MDVRKRIREGFVLLDGAFGTVLQKRGLLTGHNPGTLSIEIPGEIERIHREYIEAGSQIIVSNTFSANEYKLKGEPYTVEEVIIASLKAARNAAEGKDVAVALDVGPIGELLEPMGSLTFERAYEIFKRQVVCAAGNGADLIYMETMSDLNEVRAAILAAKENCDLPVFCTMTFEDNMRTFMGTSIESFALTACGLGVDALGINCSLGPREIRPIAEKLAALCPLPIIAKPNAGLPDPNSAQPKYDIDSDAFVESLISYTDFGVTLLGGCCGTDAAYIKKLGESLKKKNPVTRDVKPYTAVCSPSKTVVIDGVRIIGERINPTGKKLFKAALENGDIDYILSQGVSQVDAGADILDVNVGLPSIDEKAMMVRVVKGLQGILDAPLQIDSSDPAVIEAALRVYCGKALVNSVNGEEKSLSAILPLVKKYGAAVVGLTLDERGIPDTAEGRVEIAEKIVRRAAQYGIPKEDIFIDCLTLTVSAQQEGAAQTLKALETVKEKLGVKTVLGVSNISFGLPARELINTAFLTMAMERGLDLPIINPNIECMTDAIDAFNVLSGKDIQASRFIARHSGAPKQASPSNLKENATVEYTILKGLREETTALVKKLLETHDDLTVINGYLIPALDKVGVLYEKGELFLPQLIQSAEAAKGAFELIKARIAAAGGGEQAGEKIVLATVQGDIHDIGKNIVKVILENYGYRVVDLGRDVPVETVVAAAKEQGAKLVGLSALMTTTLKSMEATIAGLRETCDCKVVVGGAVLTPDYAKKIGADYYARDAKEAVDVAKEVFR